MTLTDDETASTAMTLSVDRTEVAESSSGEPVEVTATLDGAALGTATDVTVSVAGGTATAGDDFAAVDDVTVTIAAGDASGTGTFTLVPVDDDVDEADETVTVSGTTTSDLTVTPTAGLTVTITDDDERGVAVQPTELHMRPGEHKSYTVRLSSQPTETATVRVIVPPDRAADLTVEPATLTFPPATWQTPQTVTVTAGADSDAAASGTRLELRHAVSGGDYDRLPAQPVEVSITGDETDGDPPQDDPPQDDPPEDDPPEDDPPDEDPPAVSIAADAPAVEEGAPARFTVTRGGAVGEPLTVTVAVTQRGRFMAGAPPAQVRFDANARAASLVVATRDDAIDEPNGSVTATLGAVDGYVLAAAVATVRIRDNDASPAVSIADARAAESAGQITFTVRLGAASGRLVTVDYATVSGTASEGADYTGATGTLAFRPGGALTRTIAVPIVDDALDEADETFRMRLSGARSATLARAGATGTILDDDEPPELTIADRSAVESAGQMAFTVRLSAASGRRVTVSYATVSGTASEGADYTGATGTLTFEPGAALAQTIAVAVADDALDEDAETFSVALRGAVNATAGRAATGTILDDDASPELTIADQSAVEGAGSMAFAVELSAASGRQVTVGYATASGTATGGVDYTGATGTLTFEPGAALRQTVTVAIADDALDEDAETFTVALRGAVNATVGAAATGTIVDDDAEPVLTIANRSAVESAGQLVFTVELSAASGRPAGDGELRDGGRHGDRGGGLRGDGRHAPARGGSDRAHDHRGYSQRHTGRTGRDLAGGAERRPARDAGGRRCHARRHGDDPGRRRAGGEHRGGRCGGARGPGREVHGDPHRPRHGAADGNGRGDRNRQRHRRHSAGSRELRGGRAHGDAGRGDRGRHHR